MTGAVWAIGELDDGRLAASSTGVATVARRLAAAAGTDAAGVVIGLEPAAAAGELAGFVPEVLAARSSGVDDYVAPASVAATLADLVRDRQPAHILLSGTPAGRELAGALAAILQWGVLANAVDVTWADGVVVHSIIFRVDQRVRSSFTSDHGIITVQPNVIAPERMTSAGHVTEVSVGGAPAASTVRRAERVSSTAPASIESARTIVAGGAGVGSAGDWRLIEELADALDGAVGASRAAVDAGWVPYSRQIGQTGKSVRPDLYLAVGISGEIQHRVGMRMARTVVAINIDREAPMASFADLFVVGDLHEVVPLLIERIRDAGTPG